MSAQQPFRDGPHERLSDSDRKLLERLLGNWREIPASFKASMNDAFALDPPQIPISQILGFTQFTAIFAERIVASEDTASETYTDLATEGPTLEGLSPGQYFLLFGAILSTPDGASGIPLMGLSVNGSAPSDDFAVQGSSTGFGVSGMTGLPQTVSVPNTTIQAKYRTTDSGASASFNVRWLTALRFAN